MASEAEQRWVELYIETGDARASVMTCFPNTGKESSNPSQILSVRASQLKRRLSAELDKALRDRLASDAVGMLKIIRDLANTCEQPSVRLKAATDLMDRGGYKPVNETKDLTPQRTGDELRQAAITELTESGLSQQQAELIADGKKLPSVSDIDETKATVQ